MDWCKEDVKELLDALCELSYHNGHKDGYREALDETSKNIDYAFRDGKKEGYDEGYREGRDKVR